MTIDRDDRVPSTSPAAGGRPWLWVVLALALFVAANAVALGICLAHPPVLMR
jgi:hypothetical protein